MAVQSTGSRKVIDSSSAAAAYAFESGPGTLISSPSWYALNITGYGEFGGTVESYVPTEINPSRQRELGETVGLTAAAGFDIVVRQNNMNDFLEGIMFNSVYRYGYVNSTATVGNAIISATATGIDGVASQDLRTAGFFVPTGWNLLVNISGFTGAAAGNNGIKKVTAATDIKLSIAGLTAVTNANMPGVGSNAGEVVVELMGYEQTATAAVTDVSSTGVAKIEGLKLHASQSLLRPGSWIHIGGATNASKFTKTISSVVNYYSGYARIGAIDTTSSSGSLTLDIDAAGLPDAATSVAGLQIYVPTRGYRNGTSTAPFYFQFERQLGNAPGTTNKQADYVEGAIANEITIDVPTAEAVKATLAFVATDATTKNDGLKTGTRVAAPTERVYNTSSAVQAIRLYKHVSSSTKTALFAYLSDLSITINNNVTAVPAVGVVGAIDVSPGEFAVTASATTVFNDVASIQAARDNTDVGLYAVFARAKEGFLVDIPLTRLSSTSLSISPGEPVSASLDADAGRSENGYTINFEFFDYLPE